MGLIHKIYQLYKMKSLTKKTKERNKAFEILAKHHEFTNKNGEKPSEYIEDKILDAMIEFYSFKNG